MNTLINKKFTKDYEYMDIDGLIEGYYDPSIIINGVDHINDEAYTAIEAFRKAGIANEKIVFIPEGTLIKDIKTHGGSQEFTLLHNDKTIILDLVMDDEEEVKYLA